MLALLFATALAADASPRGFLGPGGVLGAGHHAVLVTADTELTGYPTVYAGWRVGLGGTADLGIEAGGNDKAWLARLHTRLRLVEAVDDRLFLGLRLRVEAKRHLQTFPPGEFRPIDDLGATVIPELSLGGRIGRERRHAVGWLGYVYVDLDVRPGVPPELYAIPGGVFYEHASRIGVNVLVDAAVGFELGNPATAAFPIPRIELVVGWIAPRARRGAPHVPNGD